MGQMNPIAARFCQAVLSNSGAVFLAQILRMTLGLFFGIWMAKWLGKENFGLLATSQAIVVVVSIFSEIALRQILVIQFSKRPRMEAQIAAAGYAIWTFTGTLGATAVVIWWLIERSPLSTLVMIQTLHLPFFGWVVWNVLREARHEAGRVAKGLSLSLIATAMARTVVILRNADVTWAAVANTCESWGNNLMGWRFRRLMSWPPRRKIVKSLLVKVAPHFLASAGLVLLSRTDILLLQSLRGNGDAGIYNAGLRFSEVFFVVSSLAMTVVLPRLVELLKKSKPLFMRRSEDLMILSGLFAWGIIIVVYFLAPFIINTLYGAEYAGSEFVLRIHIFSILLAYLGDIRANLLLSLGLTRYTLILILAAACLNFGLNWWWITLWGANGAALATVITYFLTWVLGTALIPGCRWILIGQLKAMVAPYYYLTQRDRLRNSLRELLGNRSLKRIS